MAYVIARPPLTPSKASVTTVQTAAASSGLRIAPIVGYRNKKGGQESLAAAGSKNTECQAGGHGLA